MSIRSIDLNHFSSVLEVLALQQLAYRVEADLIGFDDIPPLLDSPSTLRQAGEQFLGFYKEDKLVGAVAYQRHHKELTICRMMVHPDHFRQGIAAALLAEVERLAVPGLRLHVSTGTRNEPAIRLYEKFGFTAVQDQEVAPGVTITKFSKIHGVGEPYGTS